MCNLVRPELLYSKRNDNFCNFSSNALLCDWEGTLHYRPWSRGDNTFGSVHLSICPFVLVCGSHIVHNCNILFVLLCDSSMNCNGCYSLGQEQIYFFLTQKAFHLFIYFKFSECRHLQTHFLFRWGGGWKHLDTEQLLFVVYLTFALSYNVAFQTYKKEIILGLLGDESDKIVSIAPLK